MDEAKTLARLGTAIREERAAMGISQETFADLIGMHRAQYSRIERGETNVTVTTLQRIAKGLGTSLASLAASARL
jgi:transcriptional regulator with XRE-family HTH domain